MRKLTLINGKQIVRIDVFDRQETYIFWWQESTKDTFFTRGTKEGFRCIDRLGYDEIFTKEQVEASSLSKGDNRRFVVIDKQVYTECYVRVEYSNKDVSNITFSTLEQATEYAKKLANDNFKNAIVEL